MVQMVIFNFLEVTKGPIHYLEVGHIFRIEIRNRTFATHQCGRPTAK